MSSERNNSIQGHYKGSNWAFGAVAVAQGDYQRMLGHLRTVLAAAKAGGDPRWRNQGIQVTEWVDDGVAVAYDEQGYDTLAAFDAVLTATGIRPA
jgi:hypothetical protein